MSFLTRIIGDSIELEDDHFITSNSQFTFGVERDALLNLEDEMFSSPTFIAEDRNEWRVHFSHCEEFVHGFLQLVHSKSQEEIKAAFRLCILDASKKIKWAGSVKTEMFVVGQKEELLDDLQVWFWGDSSHGFLVDGFAYFHLQISTQQLKIESELQAVGFSKEQLTSFLENGDFTDVVLSSGNREFRASKIILAAQSPVFCAMFKSSMIESEANAVVKIEDFSDEIIKGLLEFIYTGDTGNLEENAEELLKISDKYQTMGLKGKCEKMLLKNLNSENAMDILVLAYLHSPQFLKPKITSFVNKHFKELKNTESYQRIKKEYPQVIVDLYEDAMK